MSEPERITEEAIFAEVKQVVSEADPVPPEMLAAAVASRVWRRVDEELAELINDSVVDAGLIRSDRRGRQLTFAGSELSVELEVGPASLEGQLVPPQRGEVEVRHRGGTLSVAADHLGQFRLEDVPHGPVSLKCRPEGGGMPTITSWVVI